MEHQPATTTDIINPINNAFADTKKKECLATLNTELLPFLPELIERQQASPMRLSGHSELASELKNIHGGVSWHACMKVVSLWIREGKLLKIDEERISALRKKLAGPEYPKQAPQRSAEVSAQNCERQRCEDAGLIGLHFKTLNGEDGTDTHGGKVIERITPEVFLVQMFRGTSIGLPSFHKLVSIDDMKGWIFFGDGREMAQFDAYEQELPAALCPHGHARYEFYCDELEFPWRIMCPICKPNPRNVGFDYIHFSLPRFVDGLDDHKASPVVRGSCIQIDCYGENCGHKFMIVIGFHKGNSYLWVEKLAKDYEVKDVR